MTHEDLLQIVEQAQLAEKANKDPNRPTFYIPVQDMDPNYCQRGRKIFEYDGFMPIQHLSENLREELTERYGLVGNPADDLRWLDSHRQVGMTVEDVRDAVANSCQNLGWNPDTAWWVN